MTTYVLSANGTSYGTYSASSAAEALDVMARDAGHESFADMAEALGMTAEEAASEWKVEQTDAFGGC